jgi:predicted small secreted protein
MTNKYEDFAESFTYYILHNKDFLKKTKTNSIIKQKYDFFGTYIFKNKEFFRTKFNNEEVKVYYRDITKLKFNENKLFNYLEKIKNSLY